MHADSSREASIMIGDYILKQLIAATLKVPVQELFTEYSHHGSVIMRDNKNCPNISTSGECDSKCVSEHRTYMLQMQLVPKTYTLNLLQFSESVEVNRMVKDMIDMTVSLFQPLKNYLTQSTYLSQLEIPFTYNINVDVYGTIYLEEAFEQRIGVCFTEVENESR